jgi:hypothetical protein
LSTTSQRFRHSQRAGYEDPVKINAWFKLVEKTRLAHRIPVEHVYNCDETGFIMGVAATLKVITSANTIGRATSIQLGNREWVTTIECINASGWRLLPFVILSGKLYQASWYKDLPNDWVVAISDNG